jgi:hypothetical protein
MIKLIVRAGCLTIIAAVAFVAIALMSGGEKFRWFGEKVGGIVKKGTGELGEQADRIRDTGEKVKKTVDKVTGPGEERK